MSRPARRSTKPDTIVTRDPGTQGAPGLPDWHPCEHPGCRKEGSFRVGWPLSPSLRAWCGDHKPPAYYTWRHE